MQDIVFGRAPTVGKVDVKRIVRIRENSHPPNRLPEIQRLPSTKWDHFQSP